MFNIFISITTFILSILATWYFARKYYRSSIQVKKLKIQLSSYNYLLPTLDSGDEIKKLTIKYENRYIEKLIKLKLIIRNAGNQPLSNLIKPLTMSIPKELELLEQTIDNRPTGRDIKIKFNPSTSELTIPFDLLNSDEFIEVSLLFSCNSEFSLQFREKIENLNFKVTAEGLPSIILIDNGTPYMTLKNNEYTVIEDQFVKDHKWLEKASFSIKVLINSFIFLGFIYVPILLLIGNLNSEFNIFNKAFYGQFGFLKALVYIGWITTLFSLLNLLFVLYQRGSKGKR